MPIEQISIGNCSVEVMRGDITRIAVDAIVNAANSALAGGGGVDGAIHAAGGPSLMQELRRFPGCPAGSAVVTGAGDLPAKYVFHAVGPVFRDGQHGEPVLLASCYRVALELAEAHGCRSVSFPCISTGIYGYPLAEAADVALSAIGDKLSTGLTTVSVIKLVQFSDAGYKIYQARLGTLSRRHSSDATTMGVTS